jgi:serine/threonine-protein kinase
MGEVYLAHDTELDRRVALKILPTQLAANQERMRRFRQEAKAAAALNHPNIAHIYEIGDSNGVTFIAMEFIDGQTLRQLIRAGETELPKLLRYLQHTAEGLAKAHAAGIVHRDLKPENLMITREGHAKILDFGLAKLIEAQRPSPPSGQPSSELSTAIIQHQSTPGLILGTVGYMSPEQAQGRTKDIDHRSDIFAFGCILFEAVTGRRAFEGKDAVDSLNRIIREPVRSITDLRPDAPADLQRILRRCLAKDPEERYQAIKDVAIELKEVRRELQDRAMIGSVTESPDEQTFSGPVSTPATAGTASGLSQASSAEFIFNELKRRKLWVFAGVVMVLGVIVLGFYLRARNSEGAIDSIAVLPFENQNHDANTDYLSDGVTESIINSLTQIPNLRVIARGSSFRYKGRDADPVAVGHELGVRAVLTGRLLQRGDNLTVSAELVDVRDNKQLWGDQYQRKISDLLAVQREIATEISGSLRLKLSAPEQTRITKRYTDNPEAYQLYLQGRFYWNKRTEGANKKALDYFQEAIAKDPTYALAYTGIADSYSLESMHIDVGSLSPSEAAPKAKAAAMKALEMDDSLSEAHTSLAFIKLIFDWDFTGSETEFKRALALNPNDAAAHHWHSHLLMAIGRTQESLAESKRALELDPLGLIINVHLGWHYLNAHEYDLGINQLQKALEMDPNFGVGHWYLGLCYEQKGKYAEAESELRKAQDLLKENPAITADIGHLYAVSGRKDQALKLIQELSDLAKRKYVSSYNVGLIYFGLGEKDHGFEWLENAYRERSDMLVYLNADSRLADVHADPRFADLAKRVGLPH